MNVLSRIRSWNLYDWQCICFIVALVLIPLHATHQNLTFGFLGSMSNKLSIYPILVGLFLYICECYKAKTLFVPKKYMLFVGGLIGIQLVSIIHGLVIFPRWELISADQFDKLEKLVSLLSIKGFAIDGLLLGKIWLTIKLVVRVILDTLFTYGVAIWGGSLFLRNIKRGLHSFLYGILISAIICAVYFVVELAYQFDAHWAQVILASLNPLLYDVASSHGWWPPLFFGNRIRSLFAEPAYMATFLSVAIICAGYQFIMVKNKRWFWCLLFMMLIIMMVSTNSKTAFGILIAEFIFMGILLFLARKRLVVKRIVSSMLIILLALGIGAGIRNQLQQHYAIEYDVVSVGPNNSIVIDITNRGWMTWHADNGYGLVADWYNKDWQGYDEIKVPINQTIAPGESYTVQLDLGTSPDETQYPNVVIELEKNNIYEERRLSNEGAGKLVFVIENGKLVDLGEKKQESKASMTDLSKSNGSNQQRYGMMLIDTKIGLEYPILGVGGSTLKQGYIVDRLPESLKNNSEVKLWRQYQEEKGIFRSGFPPISEYSNQFASYGFLGLLLFLLPSLYILWLLVKSKDIWSHADRGILLQTGTLCIALFGLMVSFIGGTTMQLYIYWLLLGCVIAWCEQLQQLANSSECHN